MDAPNLKIVALTPEQYEAFKVFFPAVKSLNEIPKPAKKIDERKQTARRLIEAHFKKKYPLS